MPDEGLEALFRGSLDPPEPRRKRAKRSDLEGPVVRECLLWLASRPEVKLIERRNTGAVQFSDGRFLRFGAKGRADIWCLVATTKGSIGDEVSVLEHVEIECKRRDGKGKLSPAQRDFQDQCGADDIPHFVATSAEDLEQKLKKACLIT